MSLIPVLQIFWWVGLPHSMIRLSRPCAHAGGLTLEVVKEHFLSYELETSFQSNPDTTPVPVPHTLSPDILLITILIMVLPLRASKIKCLLHPSQTCYCPGILLLLLFVLPHTLTVSVLTVSRMS